MNKIFITIVIWVTVAIMFCSCQLDQEQMSEEFYYDSEKYTIIDMGEGFVGLPESVAALEKSTINDYYCFDGDCGVIVVCKVAGKSINRVNCSYEDSKYKMVITMLNHVVTPVEIIDIIFASDRIPDDINFKEGDIVYLSENFFYITEETPEYFEYHGENTVASYDYYYPIEKNKIYIAYGSYCLSESNNYDGNPLIDTQRPGSVYCLSDDDVPKQKEMPVVPYNRYKELWQEAKDKYGYLAKELE